MKNIDYRILMVLIKAVARLPLGILYVIGDCIAFVLHRVVRYRLTIVRRNLGNVFPEKSHSELVKIERNFYRHFVDIMMETIKLADIKDEEILKRVDIKGIELVNDAVGRGHSVILMLGHFGNWEWVTTSALKMCPEAIPSEIYHQLGNKCFDRILLHLRSRFGTRNIKMSNSVRTLLRIHSNGGKFVCGFIADQRPFSSHLKYWTTFCGLDTAYVNGGETIGRRVGAEFIYVEMMPVKRGYYKLTFSQLDPMADGEENPYTRAFLNRLEVSIRQNPSFWLWSHNRWKRKRNL